MKTKLFLSGILSVLLVFGFIAAGCDSDNGGGGDSGEIKITLTKADGWDGYEYIPKESSLINGQQIGKGDYTFTYSFKSNVEIGELVVVLIDNSNANSWGWKERSDKVTVKNITEPETEGTTIPANTEIQGSVIISVTEDPSEASAWANQLVFNAYSTTSAPTLTFTKLSLAKK
jgi:hypothetical protein